MTRILPQAPKLAMLTMMVALAACTQVQDSLQSANEKIHDLVGSTASSEKGEADTPAKKSSTPVSTAADADVALAVRLMEGDGVPRDPARAVELVRPHAEAGHAEAQFLLGLAYGNGQGVEKDRDTAISWYRRAAAQDQAHAQFLLGLASLRGDGTEKDPNKAAEWFGKSARNGNAGAQYHLAVAYERGRGIEKDEAAAAQWYERAAEQGHADAQFKTGAAYQVGRGVPKNRAWATRWFAKAALQGVASGQYMTGLAYASGSGVPKDNAVAYRWFSVAAERGFNKAEPFRDRVGERLSEDRRAKEHAAAQNWKPVGAARVTGVDDSPSITFAQHTLASLGFKPGVADGKFGPKTSGAVKAYETAKGLPVSGAITRDLLIKLKDDPIHAS
jgi:TPR repeat protein